MKEYTAGRGPLGVKIVVDEYGMELLTCRNGYQWTGQPVTDELLALISLCIQKYETSREED